VCSKITLLEERRLCVCDFRLTKSWRVVCSKITLLEERRLCVCVILG